MKIFLFFSITVLTIAGGIACSTPSNKPKKSVSLVVPEPLVVRVLPAQSHQTMHSFGASDCWSAQFIGKNYPLAKREQIADWLFSMATDKAGNPKGIGLSLWRFNIGAGSTEQGDTKCIELPDRIIDAKTYGYYRRYAIVSLMG